GNVDAFDIDANFNLLLGSDGGVWRYDIFGGTWTDLNGTLQAVGNFRSVAVVPSNPFVAFGASSTTGVARFSGTETWDSVGSGAATVVKVDPANPNNVYELISVGGNAGIHKSTTGGVPGSFGGSLLNTVNTFILDTVNTSRILADDGAVEESIDGGNTFNTVGSFFSSPNANFLAAASYQG